MAKKISPMKTSDVYKQIRKPMPAPSQVMGERKRKNAYRRTEKHKTDFRDFSP
jgi:hypothetical protein